MGDRALEPLAVGLELAGGGARGVAGPFGAGTGAGGGRPGAPQGVDRLLILTEGSLEIHVRVSQVVGRPPQAVEVGVDGPPLQARAGAAQRRVGSRLPGLGHDDGHLVLLGPVGQLGDASEEGGALGTQVGGPGPGPGRGRDGSRHREQEREGTSHHYGDRRPEWTS